MHHYLELVLPSCCTAVGSTETEVKNTAIFLPPLKKDLRQQLKQVAERIQHQRWVTVVFGKLARIH